MRINNTIYIPTKDFIQRTRPEGEIRKRIDNVKRAIELLKQVMPKVERDAMIATTEQSLNTTIDTLDELYVELGRKLNEEVKR